MPLPNYYTITADELATMVKAREILVKHKHPGEKWVTAFLNVSALDMSVEHE